MVPQGSILGPILFLFYINDIVRIYEDCKYIIYADDCSVLLEGRDFDTIKRKGDTFCHNLQTWCKFNRLILNESKTKCVLFRTPGILGKVDEYITLGPFQIKIEKHIKILGVIFSENMSWNEHVKTLLPKLSRAAGVLSRNRHTFPTNIKRMLYFALFNSHLYYCTLIWGNTTLSNLQKIFLVQKKALRSIENAAFLEHTEPLFHRHRIMKIHNIYKHKLLRTYKNATLGRIELFEEIANLRENTISYPFRYHPPYHVPFSRTHYGKEKVDYVLATTLNELDKINVDVHNITKKTLLDLFM